MFYRGGLVHPAARDAGCGAGAECDELGSFGGSLVSLLWGIVTQRRLWLSAVILAAFVQAGFVAAYYYSTEGCFCAITTTSPKASSFCDLGFSRRGDAA